MIRAVGDCGYSGDGEEAEEQGLEEVEEEGLGKWVNGGVTEEEFGGNGVRGGD